MASSTRNILVYLKKIWDFNAIAEGFPPVYTSFVIIRIPWSIEAFAWIKEKAFPLDININFQDLVENALAKLFEKLLLNLSINTVKIVTTITEVLRYLDNNINIPRVSVDMSTKLTEKVQKLINLYSIRMDADGFSALWRKVMEWDDNFNVAPTVPYYMADWDNSTFLQLDVIG